MRLDILKAAIVKHLTDDPACNAELAGRIHQNQVPPPAKTDSDLPTCAVIELAQWAGEDETLSVPTPQTVSIIRLIVGGTDFFSVNRATSAIRVLYHQARQSTTVSGLGDCISETFVESVTDLDMGVEGLYSQVIEVSFAWRTVTA